MSRLLELLPHDVVAAAPHLLGWRLRRGGLEAQIVEVEAYRASDDPAAHSFGKTKMKNMAMFGPPGHAYVYFNYGCHWMLNLVAGQEGDACAILIRAAQPLSGLEVMRERRSNARRDEDLLSGPGKLAAAFGITNLDNGTNLLHPSPALGDLCLSPPLEPIPDIVEGPRVGIALGKAHDRAWRFIDAARLKWASKPWPKLGQGTNHRH
ncbi:MAG: DNA-3-methyladenine glycosylase [Chlorobia bacterium]|nr:DNA-3-methyladenine glycosylase [Fimbriimonadaceae bacterium]